MRIKKKKKPDLIVTNGVGDSDDIEEDKLLQCIMCNCMTIEEYLKRHIRYNHLISKEEIIDKLYNLHYPKNFVTVGTQTSAEDQLNGDADGDGEGEDEGCKTDDNDLGEEEEEDVEATCVSQSNEREISPTSRNVDKKPPLGDEQSYSNRFVNETITEDHSYNQKSVLKEKNIDKEKEVDDEVSDESEHEDNGQSLDNQGGDSAKVNDHNYGKREKEFKRSNGKSPVRLNKLEDLCDMSKGELKDLCYSEGVSAQGTREDLEERLRRHFKKDFKVRTRKNVSKLSEITEGDSVCSICGLGWEVGDSLELGPLYQYGSCVAHLHCLMFSSGLIQRGEESQGIIGFLPADIQAELSRGSKLRCAFCSEVFATVGCCQRSCTKSYHLPCGIKYGAICEYYGNFDSYCPTHRTKRVPKNRPRNYVLTDQGLIQEHKDIDADFDPEKYKLKLKKLERDKIKHSGNFGKDSNKKVINGNKRRGESKGKRDVETSDEEDSSRNKKVKKIHIKEEKTDSLEVEGGRRSGRRIVKKTPGSDIYRSAVDELKKILEKKELIKVDDTFSELAGTSRKKRRVPVKKENYESDEDVNWVRPRYGRRSPKLERPMVSQQKPRGKHLKRPNKRLDEDEDEDEESLESIKIFLKDSKKPASNWRRISESSEEDLPYPKIRKKSKPVRREEEINRDMETMLEDDEDRNSDVNIDQLIDDLEEDEEPSHCRKRMPAGKVMLGKEGCDSEEEANLTESSDFEITEKESSIDSDSSPKSKRNGNTKTKKGVSFSADVTEFYEDKNSKFFNVDNLLERGRSNRGGKTKGENEVLPSCYVTVHLDEPKQEAEDSQDNEASPPPVDASDDKAEAEDNHAVIDDSSDDEAQPPPQKEATDEDFDSLFSRNESENGEMETGGETGNDPHEEDEPIPSVNNSESPDSPQETSDKSDILNKAVEESGIADEPPEHKENRETINESDDPFSTSPFKLLFSTIGGLASDDQDRSQSDTENLSSSLDPDEFLQKHFK